MLRVHTSGGPTGQADGSIHSGQQSMPIKTLHGRTKCHCRSSQHMGPPLAKEESFIPLQQSVGMRYMAKGVYWQPEIMALVCMLYFCAARFDIHVMVTHIAATTNVIADAISHIQIGHFNLLVPNAADLPDPIPAWPTQFWTDCSFSTSQ